MLAAPARLLFGRLRRCRSPRRCGHRGRACCARPPASVRGREIRDGAAVSKREGLTRRRPCSDRVHAWGERKARGVEKALEGRRARHGGVATLNDDVLADIVDDIREGARLIACESRGDELRRLCELFTISSAGLAAYRRACGRETTRGGVTGAKGGLNRRA